MHAGDALWYLYGGLAVLDKMHAEDADHLLLVHRMRECVAIIGQHIAVPVPPALKLNELIDQLMISDRQVDDDYSDPMENGPPAPEKPAVNFSNDGDNVEFALTLLDEMEGCGEFDWSQFVLDLHKRLHEPDAYFSPKQWRGVIRTARKNEEFWEMFEDNNPECVKHGMKMVREANKLDS
jgi:hypothetical protein